MTAGYDDFADVIVGKLPLFVGVVIGLGCVLLLLAFRSIGIPLKAAVMNVAAVAAAFGVVVAVFQWGWGSELLGPRPGRADRALPARDHGVGALRALHGLPGLPGQPDVRGVAGDRRQPARRTGRPRRDQPGDQLRRGHHDLVFLAFVLSGDRVIAMFGIGLAAAVALDAFVLRTLLVPALMHLLGGANWWLPRWLDRRMPRISIEPPECRAAHERLAEAVDAEWRVLEKERRARMYAISLGDDGAELRPLEPWHAEEFLAHLERGREFIGQYIPFGSKATDVGLRARGAPALRRHARRRHRLAARHLAGRHARRRRALPASSTRRPGTARSAAGWSPPAPGRGLVTRAIRVLIDWAVEQRGIHRVEWIAAVGQHAQPERRPAARHDPRRRAPGGVPPSWACGTTSRCGPCSPRSGAQHARVPLTTIIKGPLRERPYGARHGNQDS